jgi:hypothetical protein
MEKTKILTVLIAITISFSGAVGQDSQGTSTDDVKGRPVKGIKFDQVSTINALTRALSSAKVPGGVATITTCGVGKSHDLAPLGPTLGEALDAIVIADPEYRWYIDQGAVNVVLSNNELTLLDVVIPSFTIDRAKRIEGIVIELLAIPEVKEGITRLQLSPGSTGVGITSLVRPGFVEREENKGFTFHLQNITVRVALNAVARMHGSAVWAYQEKRCDGRKEFSIQFLVQ